MIICPRERFAGAFLLYLSNDAQKNYLHCPDRLDGELVRGVAQSYGGISLAMKDLAKIGRLYLDGGVWNGRRIVSEEWIRQSTAYDTSNEGYHFNWYNTSSSGMRKPAHPGTYALGIKGQVLYFNPDQDLIMVRLGLTTAEPAFIPELFEELANVWPE